jgi:hypothetical protein
MYEVTGNAHKHIAFTSQRRASTRRQLAKDDEMLATHVRISTGHTRSDGASHRIAKLYHSRLATEVRIELSGQAENRASWLVAVGTDSGGPAESRSASFSDTCSHVRFPRKPASGAGADGSERYDAILRRTSKMRR